MKQSFLVVSFSSLVRKRNYDNENIWTIMEILESSPALPIVPNCKECSLTSLS